MRLRIDSNSFKEYTVVHRVVHICIYTYITTRTVITYTMYAVSFLNAYKIRLQFLSTGNYYYQGHTFLSLNMEK